MLQIEVAYALPARQKIIALSIEEGATIESAIRQSGMLVLFSDIDLASHKVGVFSKPKQLADIVHAGDRIEIYRPLLIDPKEARRKRASST